VVTPPELLAIYQLGSGIVGNRNESQGNKPIWADPGEAGFRCGESRITAAIAGTLRRSRSYGE
jgi:hypothetical protein